jgi:hypothetical protein
MATKKSKIINRKTRKTKKTRKTRGGNDFDFINICSDSSYCLSFGIEADNIINYFDGYKNFDLVKIDQIKRLGKPSNNGFVTELPYSKDNYESFAVLKSSVNEIADNLIYEGIVGSCFVNKMSKRFPCFVETYGIGHYKDYKLYEALLKGKPITKEILKTLKIKLPTIDKISESCKNAKYNCVLIQHLKNIESINDAYQKIDVLDLAQYIYQVYSVLDKLNDVFTHYDLHSDNVVIYYPSQDKYVTMIYNYSDGTKISFKTKGIAKMIDYGRSYFYVNKKINSTKIYETICKTPSCNTDSKPPSPESSLESSPSPESSLESSSSSSAFLSFPSSSSFLSFPPSPSTSQSPSPSSLPSSLPSPQEYTSLNNSEPDCGIDKGYGWFQKDENYYIESKKRNMSHDLRLLNIFESNGNVTYKSSLSGEYLLYDHNFGTKEIINSKIDNLNRIVGDYPNKIVNVTDAHLWFQDILLSNEFIESNNKQFKYSSELGKLEIWLDEDRPMIYTQTTQTTKQKKNNLYT